MSAALKTVRLVDGPLKGKTWEVWPHVRQLFWGATGYTVHVYDVDGELAHFRAPALVEPSEGMLL